MKYIISVFFAIQVITTSISYSSFHKDEVEMGSYTLNKEINNNTFDPAKQWKKITGASFIVLVIVGLTLIPKGILIYVTWKKSRKEVDSADNTDNETSDNKLLFHVEPKFDIYFDELRDLAMKNDPVFLKHFMEAYPEFMRKLLEKHPELSKSELLLCAMIFLNFTSKEIAEYTYIQHRSVQTNRSRLRKKMELTPDVDLYQYIRSFEN